MTLATARLNAEEKDKKFAFTYDIHEESPVGVVMEGVIDPLNDVNNTISTFLKIAGTYIPILESLSGNENSLTWQRNYDIVFPGVDMKLGVYVQLIVGWRVTNDGFPKQGLLNVTYTPFAWGWLNTTLSGTALPGRGSYTTDLEFIRAYAPISLEIYDDHTCFGGDWNLLPITLQTRMNIALQECSEEIIDEVINQVPIYLSCNLNEELDFPHLDEQFSDYRGGILIDDICIDYF